ncbi:hypothetical protein JZ751_002956 [Albula glossodonta]|uniref:Calponin-homology (CH) domain-containing protein n=1 Tax=Albula glossodonta TaxID=121402 RepID=A0A8T2N8D0_9TELE|nr:hypothetical protein JZ751_002956 [Albula glossodonta]
MESRRGDPLVETGAIPLDIDDVHMLLQVEQEQIQKRTFTNWINAQLAKRKPPCAVLDLFNDFRDGSRLLDLLEVMSGQHMSRERGRGVFQHRSNIETALAFLRRKSIKLVNINIPDIMDGKPSIILGLIWMIILHFHIEELACTLSFSSRQSSLESLASLDSHSTSSRSTSSSPLPRRGSPLHTRFRISAKKALLLWVREQLHKVGCTLSVKDFKASWRSGVVFLAILCALRPDLVDLSKARNRSNKQNLEEAFRMAEQELRIPKLLEPEDVDVRDPDEKSIMTYVAQFLQYSQDLPISEEEMQTSVSQKAREVSCWLVQAYQELIEGWASTEGESYAERYHVFQTFVVSFNEQRRPVMPLLTAMRRSPQLSEDQRALRRAWDSLAEKGALTDEDKDTKDHAQAAEDAREKLELLKTSMEEMSHQLKTFNSFLNMDEYGAILVPTDKMEEIKRRFTSVRVTAKYHGIKLEYQEHRHTVLDLLGQINNKLRSWKRPYWSQEGVRLLLQDWHHIIQQMKSLEGETAASLEAVSSVKSTMGRVLSAWDSYCDCLSSLQAWLYQESQSHTHSQRAEMTPECLSEWTAHQAHLNEVGNFLTKMTAPQISRVLADEMRKVNMQWADFVKRTKFTLSLEPSSSPPSPQAVQALFREAGQLLKEPIEVLSGPLHTYRKRLQFMMKKIKEVDFDSLSQSPDCSSEILQKLKHTLPEVMLTLGGAEQVCEELQQSVSGLNSRLAELQHCETEAREVYQLLKEEWKYGQNQDPRARMFISRGLQLEGQVVTEEQDLQVMVMTAQKNSPLQYLIASAMQDRVRAAVSHSQEAVGMLSSLGARRDRSPAEDQPPPKIFIQSFTEDEPQSQADVKAQTVSEPQALVEPWVMPETHPQEQPKPPTQPKPTEQHRPDPKPLTDPQPPPEPQMQTQSQVLSHPAELAKCQVQPQPRPKTQPQSTSLPQGQPYPHPLPKIHIQDYTESQPQLPAFTYAQAVTQSLPQSQQPSQHKIESQVQTPAHTPVYSQAVSKSLAYNQDEVQTKTKAPVQSVSQTQAHMITQDQSQSQPQIKPPVLTETNVQSFTQALPLASVHEHHSQVTAQSKAQKLQSPKMQPQPGIHTQTQVKVHSQAQSQDQNEGQPRTGIHTQAQVQVHPLSQNQALVKPQPSAQVQTEAKVQPYPLSQPQPEIQYQPWNQTQAQTAPISTNFIQVNPQPWSPAQPKEFPQSYPQTHRQIQPHPWAQNQVQTPPQAQAQIQPQPWSYTETQDQIPPQAQAKVQPKPGVHTQTQIQVQPQAQTQVQVQTWAHSKTELPPQVYSQTQAQIQPHPKSQDEPLQQPATRTKAPALAQAPPQAYTEAYSKAQALARDRFEEAKHCLQDHILEAITIFNDKQISEEQLGEKEETFKSLDPELLEEFLRAAEGMEAFCTVAQLRDMEFFTESVRTQWEAILLEIEAFLKHLRFEIERRKFHTAALQCEMLINKERSYTDFNLAHKHQACFSSERSLAQAGQQLGALKELCDTLSPEDAHRLAQAQLQECERRLAAIQRQFSGDRDTPPPGTGHPVELAKDEAVRSQSAVLLAAPHDRASPQVIVGAGTIEVKKVEKILIEDEAARKDALDRYRDSKSIFQAQLAKTKPSLQSFSSDAVSPADLHIQLQELEALKKETQRLWSEFALQGSKCSQFEGEECSVEKDKTELMQQWQTHQICLQGRIKSLQTAVGLIDPMEKQISHISERLDNFIKKPKDITAFSLTDSHCLQDIKGLEEDIQHEMSQLGRLDHEDSPDLSELDPEDRLPLSCMALACRQTLDHLRQQVKKSEAATRALDRFLMSLRTVEQDITGTRAAPCEDADVLRECRSRLGQIRQSVHSMGDKAPQLDRLLQGAGLSVTQDGAHVSCLDMVSALERRLEEADAGLARQQQGVQREQDMRSLGLRKRTLLGALRKLQDGAEHQGLKEPTMPAVQHRMRALTDLESRLTAHHTELLALQHAANADDQEELESQWEDSHRAVTEGLEQCRALMELLKKFQNCRSRLNNTLQRAEQTISEQASYMGKDNLQRLITTVIGIKEDLGGLGEGVEEIRGVCRQLQSQLKKIPECRDAPFESEADALVDRWLDVTEKTDSYMDNLHVGLELWDKLQLLGGEVDSWMGKKLSMFAERHPFQTEEEVMALQDEIQSQEENIERFHRKSIEIQELLQSKESPLELQVMETQLRKKMEQVKELFADSSDVFQELMAVRQHIAERMAGCQSSLEAIQAAMNTLSASENPQLPNQIQELAMRLQAEAEQADSLLKEINLMSSVASPQALQTLTAEGARLKESVHTTQELISQKKEQVERGFLRVIKDECQAFEEWFQDLQLSVNECFENPERRQDVEASMQKLTAFLEYKEGERRLGRLKERVARAGEQLSLEQLDPLNMWLQEQEEELTTFRAHCQERRNHLEACLRTINSLQDEYSHLKAWLQDRELKSVQGEELHHLHEEVRKERQGLRSDGLVRESDDMLQRYHSLQARLIRQTEAQSALARESQEFEAQAESIKVWIRDLQQQLNSLEKGTEGSQAEVEDRLQKVQALLSARSEGDSKLQYLRQRGQTLSQQRDLEESRRGGVLQALRESEEQWRALMQSAEELCRMLQGVVDRLMSCIYQKQQAQARVEQLQQQMEELPQRFPWPGLGDRRLAMEHALSLLNRIQALTPTVSALQAQGKELFQLTQDPSWIDPSWAALEECAPRLVKDLSDTCRRLEAGIQTERHCDQLVEQHNAALHWLQEQVQGLGPVSSDRADLQSTVNTLKALLQTTDREEREMRELDTVKVSLLGLCDPSGQAALEQEVSRMQECRVHLETEARNRLQDCEARLRELEEEQDRRAQQLREEARGLQRELHSLGQRMMYCSQQADIGHLRDQWHTLKSCEGPLQELGQRIQDLQQAQGSAATEEPLPNDVISTMAAVIEEHCRLNAQLSERVGCCAEDTERSLRQCLEAVQQWNKSTHTQLSTGSSHTIQAALEEGQRLRNILEDALSHSGFLKDSLGQEQMDQLGTDSADALSTNAAHISSLTQTIQDIAEKKKHVTHGCVSEGPISATEQQLKMSLADIQVDKYKPQICHRIEEEDKVGFQSEMTPHDSKEEVLRKQDAYPSSWPTEPSIDDKATNQMQVGQHYPNTEMLVGHQPDSLMKHDKETPTEMQHSVPQQKEIQCTELLLNTAVKTELMGEKVVTVILDTDVQQIQVRGSTNQLVQPPLRENTEYRNTGNTDALTFKVQQIQPPQKENNEATVLHRDGFEIHRDATKLSASDKKQTEILSSKKQDGDLSYTIMIETEKKDEGKHWDIPDTLDTKREVAACDVPKVHSQSSEEQHQDKPKGFNTDSLDSRTEHTNIPGISGDREEHESREALQSNKMAIVILDTDILHIHTPDPWQSKSSDMLRIVSSGTGGFDTTWTPSTEGEDAKIQPSDIAQQETTWSGYTVKHRCTSPHKATEDTVAQPNERQPTDVVQLSKMLDTEVLKMEEHHCEQIPIQSQPVEPEGDKMIQDQTFTGLIELLREEATNYQEKQRRYLVLDLPEVAEAHKTVAELPVVPDRIQDHEAHPKQKQEELTDTTHLEAGESERNMQTTELQRGESERMKNAYVTQLEREPSSQMMQTDATQSEARRPGTPETLRPPVLAAAEDRITQLQKSETVEDKVPEHIKRRDSAQQHEQTPKVEGEHADTPKALDPEARNETEAKRDLLPLVNTAQTEPEPCTSDTVGKLKEDKVDRDMERPKSPQVKPPGEAVGNLNTSHRDLETRLSHVVLRILSCRNQPAQLNAIAMIQQVQEAEECRQCAQEHIAAFSRMYEVKGQDQETTQNMEGQWSAALWDGSATVHAKESQLQLVTQYHRQTLAAKATLEKLVAKLEELRNGPVESSLLEAEKLHAVLRDLEQERAVIGELLQTQTKLSPHLSQAERVMSHTQLGHLQEEWRVLERVAEKMLHHVSVTNQETGGLLLEVQELQSQLKTLQKSLGPAQPSEEQWDSQRAEQLMIIGAALKAANQNYLHLQQQTSDAHSQSLQGEKERGDIEQALLHVKEQLESLQRQVSTQSPSSSNATVGKIMKVMQDAFIWAKQKESNIEARKKVALLPEAVHSQIKGLKKLQSEISSKQSQLESLVEEVRELIPELDKKDVPMVLNSLKTLEGLSKSTSEKLAQALQEMESGLQVREKMSEQIADVDSWVVAHVHKETIRESNGKSSTLDLERKLRQLQETLKEADKQAAVTEALLMRSRDIAPELSIAENCLLNDKLTSLHEDIKGIINYEKTNSQELEELLLAQDSSFKKVSSVESILRQVSVDLNRFRFPITKDSLSAVEKVEHVILEQKCQVDQLRQYKEDKSRELLCTIAEMQNKVNALSQKAEQHERYLSYRQHVEDLKVDVEAQVLKMKDENIRKEERYKNCQALLIQLPLIKSLCQAAAVELEDISRDLYPSQLSSERQRLRQVTESLSTWEMTVQNDSNILEWALLKNLHYPTERKAMVEFLKQANLELDKPTKVGLEEQAIDREFLKWATLQRNVDCRTRVLEFLEHSTEARQKGWEQENTDMADLRRKTVNGCTKRMEYLSQAKEILRVYNTAVRGAVRFLQEVESRLLLPLDCAGSCPEQLKHTQQALAFLNEKFQSHITEIHALLPQHTCLSSYDAEQLHSTILSQLLVRISTLQAQAQVLVHELKSLAERLEELGEWCPEQGCSGGREEAVSALWRLWARLQRCAHYLKARSDQRGAEWKDITKSVERATIILDQLQDELPDCTREKASLDELQEMLVYTEQYQDRLDCEHRSLMALELRVARLLGVPAHQEHSPPIPLCQELQTMQGRYKK